MEKRVFTGLSTVRGFGLLCVGLSLLAFFLVRSGSAVQGLLETPPPGIFSTQSGIGLIRGWVCQANSVEIDLDGKVQVPAVYGELRQDTQEVCGDSNNGFSYQVNWNELGEGAHTIRVLADGVEADRAVVNVVTFGQAYLRGAQGTFLLDGFPREGKQTQIRWDEGEQLFLLSNGGIPSIGGESPRADAKLESPAPGSFQSGIGLIRGWVCQASNVEIEVVEEGIKVPAVYGEQRLDTEGVCKDSNNGFSLQVNWNDIGDGTHTVRAVADGVQIGTATFTVVSLGLGRFVRGLTTAPFNIADFPRPGMLAQVRWDESLQNFMPSGVQFPGVSPVREIREGMAVDVEGRIAHIQGENPGVGTGSTLRFHLFMETNPSKLVTAPENAQAISSDVSGFFLCGNLFNFFQGQRTFSSNNIRILDVRGEEVCRQLPPGGELDVLVNTNAFSELNFNAPFTVSYNNRPTVDFPVTSQAGELKVSEREIQFSQVAFGTNEDRKFTITNVGNSTMTGGLTLQADGSSFHEFSLISPQIFSIPPGRSNIITVRFEPVFNYQYDGFVRISSSGGAATVHVTGDGVPPGGYPYGYGNSLFDPVKPVYAFGSLALVCALIVSQFSYWYRRKSLSIAALLKLPEARRLEPPSL